MPEKLRILFTNHGLEKRAGSELVVRDLARELRKRGHLPVVYSPRLGAVAEEMRQACIPVIDDLKNLGETPDIIHGQHHLEAMTAMLHFPLTPAVYVCHGWLPWAEIPPRFFNIQSYVAMGELTREHIVTHCGASSADVSIIPNFVDLETFTLKEVFAKRPTSAALFSNYAAPSGDYAGIVRMACEKAGIGTLDIIGAAANNSVANPADIIKRYDIVFAVGRSAIEAMVMGCAVIVAGIEGVAGMVTPDSVENMMGKFGLSSLDKQQLNVDFLHHEIMKYDAQKVAQVAQRIRGKVGLKEAAGRYEDVYRQAIAAWGQRDVVGPAAMAERLKDTGDYLRRLSPRLKRVYELEVEKKRLEWLLLELKKKNIEVNFDS